VTSVCSSEFYERVRESSTICGFTLIEVLIALVIAAITVAVVLESQITSLKIEQKARALQLFRFETQRIFSASHRAKNEEELTRFLETNVLCRIKSEKVTIESGTNVLSFIKHELRADLSAIAPGEKRRGAAAEDLPAFSSVFYTRVPSPPAQRSDAGGNPANADKARNQKN